MSLLPYLKGLATLVYKPSRMHETLPARYFYSVWLRHLVKASQYGYKPGQSVVAELGPGSSLGTGLAALLSGAKSYYAYDIVAAADRQHNLQVFRELIELFKARADIPDEREFPHLFPRLDSYTFPQYISSTLDEAKINRIEHILQSEDLTHDNGIISYTVPWFLKQSHAGSVDMILSQAVLEHVDQLAETYDAMAKFLKPGGFSSHNIDFRSHGITREWNGHWHYNDWQWKIVAGKRSYFINRAPCSRHTELSAKNGMDLLLNEANDDYTSMFAGSLRRDQLTSRFKNLSEADFRTCSTYMLSSKRRTPSSRAASERSHPPTPTT